MIRRHATTPRLAMMAADGLSALTLFVLISRIRFGVDWADPWRLAGIDPWMAACTGSAIS